VPADVHWVVGPGRANNWGGRIVLFAQPSGDPAFDGRVGGNTIAHELLHSFGVGDAYPALSKGNGAGPALTTDPWIVAPASHNTSPFPRILIGGVRSDGYNWSFVPDAEAQATVMTPSSGVQDFLVCVNAAGEPELEHDPILWVGKQCFTHSDCTSRYGGSIPSKGYIYCGVPYTDSGLSQVGHPRLLSELLTDKYWDTLSGSLSGDACKVEGHDALPTGQIVVAGTVGYPLPPSASQFPQATNIDGDPATSSDILAFGGDCTPGPGFPCPNGLDPSTSRWKTEQCNGQPASTCCTPGTQLPCSEFTGLSRWGGLATCGAAGVWDPTACTFIPSLSDLTPPDLLSDMRATASTLWIDGAGQVAAGTMYGTPTDSSGMSLASSAHQLVVQTFREGPLSTTAVFWVRASDFYGDTLPPPVSGSDLVPIAVFTLEFDTADLRHPVRVNGVPYPNSEEPSLQLGSSLTYGTAFNTGTWRGYPAGQFRPTGAYRSGGLAQGIDIDFGSLASRTWTDLTGAERVEQQLVMVARNDGPIGLQTDKPARPHEHACTQADVDAGLRCGAGFNRVTNRYESSQHRLDQNYATGATSLAVCGVQGRVLSEWGSLGQALYVYGIYNANETGKLGPVVVPTFNPTEAFDLSDCPTPAFDFRDMTPGKPPEVVVLLDASVGMAGVLQPFLFGTLPDGSPRHRMDVAIDSIESMVNRWATSATTGAPTQLSLMRFSKSVSGVAGASTGLLTLVNGYAADPATQVGFLDIAQALRTYGEPSGPTPLPNGSRNLLLALQKAEEALAANDGSSTASSREVIYVLTWAPPRPDTEQIALERLQERGVEVYWINIGQNDSGSQYGGWSGSAGGTIWAADPALVPNALLEQAGAADGSHTLLDSTASAPSVSWAGGEFPTTTWKWQTQIDPGTSALTLQATRHGAAAWPPRIYLRRGETQHFEASWSTIGSTLATATIPELDAGLWTVGYMSGVGDKTTAEAPAILSLRGKGGTSASCEPYFDSSPDSKTDVYLGVRILLGGISVQGATVEAKVTRPDGSALSVSVPYDASRREYRAHIPESQLPFFGRYSAQVRCSVPSNATVVHGESMVPSNDTTSPTLLGVGLDRYGSTQVLIEDGQLPLTGAAGTVRAGDCDLDGIPDTAELQADSDLDGLADPCDADSDNDGMDDSQDPRPTLPDSLECEQQPAAIACCQQLAWCGGSNSFALYAEGTLKVNDRARVVDAAGTSAAVANAGNLQTDLGTDTYTGSLWSRASVELRDRAKVDGELHTAGTFHLSNGAAVTGTTEQNAQLQFPQLAAFSYSFTQVGSGVSLEPDQQRVLSPGGYGAMVVKSRAVVKLSAGMYTVTSLQLEPQARLDVDTTNGPVYLYVRDSFSWKGTANVLGGTGRFLVGYFGQATAFIESSFTGTIVSPKAAVSLTTGTYRGAVFAKDIELHQGSTFTLEPFVFSWMPQVLGVIAVSESEPADEGLCAVRSPGREAGWVGVVALFGLATAGLLRSRRRAA
jgi:hypothetical protein